jgi:hypothetical protein
MYNILKDDGNYQVVEIATGHIVSSKPTLIQARNVAKHYNTGGGFDGWSPSFIFKKYTPPADKKAA